MECSPESLLRPVFSLSPFSKVLFLPEAEDTEVQAHPQFAKNIPKSF